MASVAYFRLRSPGGRSVRTLGSPPRIATPSFPNRTSRAAWTRRNLQPSHSSLLFLLSIAGRFEYGSGSTIRCWGCALISVSLDTIRSCHSANCKRGGHEHCRRGPRAATEQHDTEAGCGEAVGGVDERAGPPPLSARWRSRRDPGRRGAAPRIRATVTEVVSTGPPNTVDDPLGGGEEHGGPGETDHPSVGRGGVGCVNGRWHWSSPFAYVRFMVMAGSFEGERGVDQREVRQALGHVAQEGAGVRVDLLGGARRR